jgi:periplasmic protein TonB
MLHMPRNLVSALRQRYLTGTAVVLLHLAGLYGLQVGLLDQPNELIVPVQIQSEFIPRQALAATNPAPSTAAEPISRPVATTAQQTPKPAAQPIARTDTAHSALGAAHDTSQDTQNRAASQDAVAPHAAAQVTAQHPALANAAPPEQISSATSPAAGKLELPSSDADFLNNPTAPYPPASRRLGETGKVLVRVYVDSDGLPKKAELGTSSGFERLDTAGLTVAMKWRYVPGKRAGVAQAMWVNVPVTFTLE